MTAAGMTSVTLVVIAVALLGYLVVALVDPERIS